ncbi:MAG TPA: ATPase [Candidatus Micrarchaeota archaeon]|nr:ATPase [Candidatus Micrarchaeota archaeon]
MATETAVATTAATVGSTFIDAAAAKYLAAGFAIGITALATAWAQATIGASAMGVIAEKPEESGKLLIYIALPETLVVLGLIVAALMLFV